MHNWSPMSFNTTQFGSYHIYTARSGIILGHYIAMALHGRISGLLRNSMGFFYIIQCNLKISVSEILRKNMGKNLQISPFYWGRLVVLPLGHSGCLNTLTMKVGLWNMVCVCCRWHFAHMQISFVPVFNVDLWP